MSLNYTPLRHKMLAACGRGEMQYSPGWGHADSEFVPKVGYSYRGQEKRAVTDLNKAGYLTYPGAWGHTRRDAHPTESGRAALADWTSRHGEPT